MRSVCAFVKPACAKTAGRCPLAGTLSLACRLSVQGSAFRDSNSATLDGGNGVVYGFNDTVVRIWLPRPADPASTGTATCLRHACVPATVCIPVLVCAWFAVIATAALLASLRAGYFASGVNDGWGKGPFNLKILASKTLEVQV